jgi:hypothetical protein
VEDMEKKTPNENHWSFPLTVVRNVLSLHTNKEYLKNFLPARGSVVGSVPSLSVVFLSSNQ